MKELILKKGSLLLLLIELPPLILGDLILPLDALLLALLPYSLVVTIVSICLQDDSAHLSTMYSDQKRRVWRGRPLQFEINDSWCVRTGGEDGRIM